MFSNELICEIILYIDINLNGKITLEGLEKYFFYNKYYIVKLFKKEIGYTIFDYINILRIKNSIDRIKNTNDSFTKIALDNGFYSLEYFSETFKNVVGVSPRKYKKFLNFRNDLDFDTNFVISDNLIRINDLLLFIDNYLINRKPKISPVKNLTIFR